jgi:hypothetical protein
MIEAPLPLLVGITKREYRNLDLTPQEKSSKIWVFLESGEVIWSDDPVPSFDIKTVDLEFEYTSFQSTYQN